MLAVLPSHVPSQAARGFERHPVQLSSSSRVITYAEVEILTCVSTRLC